MVKLWKITAFKDGKGNIEWRDDAGRIYPIKLEGVGDGDSLWLMLLTEDEANGI